jgi:hypothetical protein
LTSPPSQCLGHPSRPPFLHPHVRQLPCNAARFQYT